MGAASAAAFLKLSSHRLCLLLAVVVLVTAVVRHAEPVHDTDPFWHMAYAEQMLERGTLKLDHTLYSWTQTSNRMIYCAWIGELLLLGLWKLAGIWGFFALRYAVMAGVLVTWWLLARRLGLARWAPAYAAIMAGVLSSYAGTCIKPELLSVLLMTLVVAAYFRGKHAALTGGPAARWFYLVPLLVLVWVNSHGAFILVAPFFVATAAGEGMSLLLNREASLRPRNYLHLLAAWALCAVVTVINPYGWEYPWQLVRDYVIARGERPDVAWNNAHQTVFGVMGHAPGWVIWMGCMLALLVPALIARVAAARNWRALDPAILLANAAYLWLYLLYLRSTPFWAPVFVGSFLFTVWQIQQARGAASAPGWLTGPGWSRAASAAGAVICVALGLHTIHAAWRRPYEQSWLGFGIAYYNPVAEAEFLAASKLGPRLINLFDTGGYLLWRLRPDYKVMVDARSFPYLDWFKEQYQFTTGQVFEPLLDKLQADVAVIDLIKEPVWRHFMRAPGWRLAYFGPTAAVFVRGTIAEDRLAKGVAPERFDHIRNAGTAARLFWFAIAAGDFDTAWKIHRQLAGPLAIQPRLEVRQIFDYHDAHQALRAGDYEKARTLLSGVLAIREVCDRDRLILTFLDSIKTAAAARPPQDTTAIKAALEKLVSPPRAQK